MSGNLPISSPYRSTPNAPVSDAERDQLNGRLNAAFEAGKLGQDDYAARLDQLFAATKLGQLVPVVEGLPPVQTYQSPAIVASSGGQPGQLAESASSSRFSLALVAIIAAVVVLIAILFLVLF